jgi:hypothetical protein
MERLQSGELPRGNYEEKKKGKKPKNMVYRSRKVPNKTPKLVQHVVPIIFFQIVLSEALLHAIA